MTTGVTTTAAAVSARGGAAIDSDDDRNVANSYRFVYPSVNIKYVNENDSAFVFIKGDCVGVSVVGKH